MGRTSIFDTKMGNVSTKVRTHFSVAGVLSDILLGTVPFSDELPA